MPCQKQYRLLGVDDPASFECLRPEISSSTTPLLIVCDHASNAVPAALNGLGLDDNALSQHIAVDIGSAGVSHLLSQALRAPAVLAGFSRLVIDANRFLSDDTSIPDVSDGVPIPGNQAMAPADRGLRVEELYIPYHQAVSAQLTRFSALGIKPVVVFVHSFTPVFQGEQRPWEIGVVWHKDPRSAKIMMRELKASTNWQIGDNEPYNACEPLGYSMLMHASRLDLPHVMLEIRQDLISDIAGEQLMADRLQPALRAVLAAHQA